MNCSICKRPIEIVGNWAHGHNAAPVTDGRACSICNEVIVLAARIELMRARLSVETFRLGSGPHISAPGILQWCLAGYRSDRTNMARVISECWGVPLSAAHALLSKRVPHEVDGETVVFSVEVTP